MLYNLWLIICLLFYYLYAIWSINNYLLLENIAFYFILLVLYMADKQTHNDKHGSVKYYCTLKQYKFQSLEDFTNTIIS